MSKKIKKINIEAFRAYEKLMHFDFCHGDSGKVADLVVIYAPNGYGKTSFFDAIEWAVTEEIGRFKSTNAIKQEVKNEKGDILKNKNSDRPQGIVQIISENDEIFERRTKKLTKQMNNDYKRGDYEYIPPELQGLLNEKNSFCTTNMLAHDKVTSFLQNYTAEDKSKALQVFWDTNGYSEYVEIISNIYNEIVNKGKILAKEIKKDKADLIKFKLGVNQEHEISQLINEFNMKSIEYKINYENLTEDIDNIFEKSSTILKAIHDKRIQNESKVTSLELLANEFSSYLTNKKDLSNMKSQKKIYEKKIEMINDVNIYIANKEKLLSEKQQLNKVMSEWNLFQQIDRDVLIKSDLKKEFSNSKPKLQKSIIQAKENSNTFKENASKYLELKKMELEDKKIIEDDIGRYNENIKRYNKYYRLLNKAQQVLSHRLDRREILSNDISCISSFIDSKSNIEQVKHCFTNEMICLNESLTILKFKKIKQDKKIIQLQDKYHNEKILYNKMNQLIIQGKELVEDSMSCECPLCHAKYNDFSELITRISVVSNSNSKLEQVKKELTASSTLKKEIDESIVIISEKLMKAVNEVLYSLKDNFNRQNEKVQGLQLRVSDWNNFTENIQLENKYIWSKYNFKKIDIQDINDINTFIYNIDLTINNLSQNIEREEKKLATNLDLIKSLESNLKDMEDRIVELDDTISKFKNNEIYQLILLFLKSKEFRIEKDNYQIIFKRIKEESILVSKGIDMCEFEIFNLQDKIDGTKNEIEQQYNTLLMNIQELTPVRDGYLLRCKKALEKVSIEEEIIDRQIDTQKINLLKEINNMDETINILKSVLADIMSLQEQKIWLDRKKDLNKKNHKLDAIKIKQKKLEQSKNLVENYIVEQTNSYFNSDTINQIYNKIDPHPTMNHIKFFTEKSEKGLQTHIYTYDESEEDKMSPILYLSSAQVNILSLCIFLAKVLTEKNTTLNTIFMDDPIQHLDGINLLAFIDLLRTITSVMGRQIVISTHNEHFYNLIKVKMDDKYYLSKFIELSNVGKVKKA